MRGYTELSPLDLTIEDVIKVASNVKVDSSIDLENIIEKCTSMYSEIEDLYAKHAYKELHDAKISLLMVIKSIKLCV